MSSATIISQQLADEAASRRTSPAIPDTVPPLQPNLFLESPTDAQLFPPNRQPSPPHDSDSDSDEDRPTPRRVRAGSYNPYAYKIKPSARDRIKATPRRLRCMIRRLIRRIKALKQRLLQWRLKRQVRKKIAHLPESAHCTVPCFSVSSLHRNTGFGIPREEAVHV